MNSPSLRAGSSSPSRFNEDDTIAGIFIGPYVDTRVEHANQRRLEHALLSVQQHESRASPSGVEPPLSGEEVEDLETGNDAMLGSAVPGEFERGDRVFVGRYRDLVYASC